MATTRSQHSPFRRHRFEVGDPSLRNLSKECGIHYSTLARIERGALNIAYHHAVAIGPLLKVEPGDLLKEMADWYEKRARSAKRRKRSARPSSPVVSPPEAA